MKFSGTILCSWLAASLTFLIMFLPLHSNGQELLPLSFNMDDTGINWEEAAFVGFEGGAVERIANPDRSGINETDYVLQYTKDPGGQPWGGFEYYLEDFVNTTDDAVFRVKVWSPRADIQARMKLETRFENFSTGDLLADVTIAGEWTQFEWDLSGADHSVAWDMVVIIMDLDVDNPPQGGADDTWYLDDFELAGVEVTDGPDIPDDPDDPFAGGDGSPEDPYQIATIEHFQNVEGNYHFVQTSNIDASGFEFTPIPSFGGYYDGGNYVITGLTIMDGGFQAAPFSVLAGGHINNLGLVDVNISGGQMTAGIVGEMVSNGLIENSFVTGTLDGELLVGGIAGFITDGEVRNSYARVDITGEVTQIGGIAGRLNETGTVRNSYAVAQVSGVAQHGVLVGNNADGMVADSYWDTEASSPASAIGDGADGTNVVGLTTAEMTGPAAEDNMTVLDFADIWRTTDDDYPILAWQLESDDPVDPDEPFAGGSGTAEDPYQIATLAHLKNVSGGAYFVQIADIDAYGDDFTPLGDFTGDYEGGGHIISNLTIDGGELFIGLFRVVAGGHIRNLGLVDVDINAPEGEMVGGITGMLSAGGSVKNVFMTGTVQGWLMVSGLVGHVVDGVIENAYAHANVFGTVTQNGAIAGRLSASGEVHNSYAVANVTGGAQFGVVVGNNDGGTVRNIYWDRQNSSPAAGVGGGNPGSNFQPLRTSQMTGSAAEEYMSALDFTEIWQTVDDGYPLLAWQDPADAIIPTSADDQESGQDLPIAFDLRQNYPNPFNPTTQIRFDLPEQEDVTLEVFNVMGQRVGVLANGSYQTGQHTVSFDATDLASGVYIYRIQAGSFTRTQKMMLVK